MKKFLLFLLLLAPLLAYGQRYIRGTVFDPDTLALPNAQVIITSNDKIVGTCLTDSLGKYYVEIDDAGIYEMEITYTGCKPNSMTMDIDGGVTSYMYMSRDTIALDSITIIGKRRPTSTATGRIYKITEEGRNSNSPFLALRDIPELYSDHVQRTVKSIDGKNMIVLVDGKEINSGINPIDPKRMESVEITDVISAKYLQRGVEKILNIRLKPQTSLLYTFFDSSILYTLPMRCSDNGISAEIGTPKVSLWAWVCPTLTWNERTNATTRLTTEAYKQTEKSEQRYNSFNIPYTLMLKWRPNKKDYLVAFFQGRFIQDHSTRDATGFLSLPDNGNYTDFSDTRNIARILSGGLYYTRDISNKKSIEMQINVLSNNADYNKYSNRSYESGHTWSAKSLTDLDRTTMTQSLTYNWYPTNKLGIVFGNNTEYIGNNINTLAPYTDFFRYRHWNEYIYAGVSGRFGKLGYSLSGGLDAVWCTSSGVFNRYFRPRYTGTLRYNSQKAGSLSLSYTHNIALPAIDVLNPFNTSTDSLTRSYGNPYLTPTTRRMLSLSYVISSGKFFANVYGGYTHFSDGTMAYSFVDKDGIYNTTYDSNGKFEVIYGYYTLGYSSRNATYYVRLWNRHDFFEGQKPKNSVGVTIEGAKTIKKLTLSAKIEYGSYTYGRYNRSRAIIPTGHINVSYAASQNLMFTAALIDMFGNSYTGSNYDIPGYHMEQSVRKNTCRPFINIRWTWRKNSKRQMVTRHTNTLPTVEQKIDL